jgi:hypothetical protein
VIPLSRERSAVKALIAEGKAHWSGGKPKGTAGIRIKGKALSKTVIEDRRENRDETEDIDSELT